MTVGTFYLRFFYEKSRGNIKIFITFAVANRGVAQLAARHVRDVEVGSSSLLTPTEQKRIGLSAGSLDLFGVLIIIFIFALNNRSKTKQYAPCRNKSPQNH